MDNRRNDYRHAFPTLPPFHAECEILSDKIVGEIVDLSVTGVKLRAAEWPPHAGAGQALRIHLCLAGVPLTMDAVLIHGPHERNAVIGIYFLPMESTAENEAREKILWSYLLHEQWKSRKLELARKYG